METVNRMRCEKKIIFGTKVQNCAHFKVAKLKKFRICQVRWFALIYPQRKLKYTDVMWPESLKVVKRVLGSYFRPKISIATNYRSLLLKFEEVHVIDELQGSFNWALNVWKLWLRLPQSLSFLHSIIIWSLIQSQKRVVTNTEKYHQIQLNSPVLFIASNAIK